MAQDTNNQPVETETTHGKQPDTAPAGPAPSEAPVDEQARVTRELEELRQELDGLKNKYLRALADYQNLMRRAAAERTEAVERARADLVKAQLVILDDFERTLEAARAAADVKTVADGVRIIFEKLVAVLETFGLERLGVKPGAPFDPTCQQALAQQPSDEVAPDHVLHVAQPGYTMKGRLLRPASVVVAAKPQEQ